MNSVGFSELFTDQNGTKLNKIECEDAAKCSGIQYSASEVYIQICAVDNSEVDCVDDRETSL